MTDFDQHPFRAYVQHNLRFMHGIDIWLVQDHYHGGRTAIGQPLEFVMAEIPDDLVGTPHPPTLTLPDDFGHALLDALATHYGGVSSLRALRCDYDAERVRVDKLIEHLARRP